jgi:hypothetical protein
MESLEDMSVRHQLLFFTILILCAGCRKEEPNPENLDKIYSELGKIKAEKEGALASEKKAEEKAKKALEEAVPGTLDLKNAARDLSKAQTNIDRLEQEVRFADIRVRRRLAEDRYNYHLAFAAGKEAEWPSKEEFEAWETNSRLRSAPMNWSARVPKLFDRKPAAKPKKAEAAEE